MSDSSVRSTGRGGEIHQTVDADHPAMTTNPGVAIGDNQNQLKAGARGPVLFEDEIYREKINHFDHERIPERIVHARGSVKADAQLFGQPSVTVDACAVVLSDDASARLVREAATVQWVMDAFGHLKAIGHNPSARRLLDKAGVEPDDGVVALDAFVEAAKTRYWDREPKVRTLA